MTLLHDTGSRISSLPAVILCGHGTRHADGAAQFVAMAEAVRQVLPELVVRSAFMELSPPLLTDALDDLYAQGVRQILVMPCLLLAAGHSKTDIPATLRMWNEAQPDVTLSYGSALGIDPEILRAAGDRIEEALAPLSAVPRDETALLSIGRGSSDPDANSDMAKIMRLLWEGMGFGWGELAFFDVTFPRIDVALWRVATMGFKRVVVSPYLLFTGVLVRRLEEEVADARKAHPAVEFVLASYLDAHAGVVTTIASRIRQYLQGDLSQAVNCRLCKYRAPVLAFDAEVGVAQLGDNERVPVPYPFASHPFGPMSDRRSRGRK